VVDGSSRYPTGVGSRRSWSGAETFNSAWGTKLFTSAALAASKRWLNTMCWASPSFFPDGAPVSLAEGGGGLAWESDTT
jgi:hypothetical protein